ncbi:hypothetical protein ACQKL5_09705 [Peribacillus sp. NPDC097675]|uniref:hypothetical protein n=1 Tax=Peribacillus sp. NPDC097675 TaxID=3390618 RepID=UPI003CFF8275
MKKLSVFILMMVFIVSGCTTRVYDSNMELGKSQLKEENYLEAYEAFELAYEDDPTAEAKELMDLSELLSKGMKKFEEQDFDGAQALFQEAAAYKAKYKEGKMMVQKASEMLKETEDASIEPVEEDMEPGESTDDEEGEDVEAIPESEAEDNPAVKTETPKEAQKEEKAGQEEPAEEKPVVDEKESDQSISKDTAEQLVKDFAKFDENPQLQIQYDHDDEKGDYIFQVFEVVNDSNEGGHTATWGWYGVNKKTKEVYEVM